MILSRRVLGASVVNHIAAKASAPLLTIGTDVFYRHDFAQIDCFNFLAAANLSRVLQDVPVRNARDLFERVPPSSLLLPHLGAVSLAVLGAAFEVKGLGGQAPLEAWMMLHSNVEDETGNEGGLVTFASMKQRVRPEPATTRHRSQRSRTRPRSRRAIAPRSASHYALDVRA